MKTNKILKNSSKNAVKKRIDSINSRQDSMKKSKNSRQFVKPKVAAKTKILQNYSLKNVKNKDFKGENEIAKNTAKSLKQGISAYKLLAMQEKISNNEAKELIDRGAVSVGGRKVLIARALMSADTRFVVAKEAKEKPRVIFENDEILALNKPPFVDSEALARSFAPSWVLLHRLDRETSGVLLLVHPESSFQKKAILEFKSQNVKKLYNAIVCGVIEDEREITNMLLIQKGNNARVRVVRDFEDSMNYLKNSQAQNTEKSAKSRKQRGLSAYTKITPLQILGKKTLLEVEIKTGRTHQIRAHLAHIARPILGDLLYGGKNASRIMLHARKISLLGYEFESPLPKEFELK